MAVCSITGHIIVNERPIGIQSRLETTKDFLRTKRPFWKVEFKWLVRNVWHRFKEETDAKRTSNYNSCKIDSNTM